MADLPDLDQAAMEEAASTLQGAGAAPQAGGVDPAVEAATAGQVSGSEIDDLLAALDEEALVPPGQEPTGPDTSGLEDIMKGLRGEPDEDEKSLLINRVSQLEEQLTTVNQRFQSEQMHTEQQRVRTAIDRSVKTAISEISVNHEKLDKAAASFIEGALVYKLAQQAQSNPNSKADSDAIKRYANKAAKALARWGKEFGKIDSEKIETRKAQAGTQSRPKATDFELKTDADFDKYVAAFIGKGG